MIETGRRFLHSDLLVAYQPPREGGKAAVCLTEDDWGGDAPLGMRMRGLLAVSQNMSVTITASVPGHIFSAMMGNQWIGEVMNITSPAMGRLDTKGVSLKVVRIQERVGGVRRQAPLL